MSKASFYGGRGVTPNNLDVDPVEPNNINAIEDSKNAAAISEANAESHKNAAAQHASDANTAKLAAQASEAGAETARTGAETAETGAASSAASAANSAATATTKASEASASAAAAATSATGAQGSATLANTERVAAGASAAAADTSRVAAQSAQTAAETAETNAATSAANAASSESTVASDAAAAASSAAAASTSETNASNSASSASTSASTATTKAGEASTSAAAAATSATSSATSAAASATSASDAASSATAAAASQVAAAQSAASAANTYDLFDDRYLGSKSSEPTVDNDGNALVQGSLYFNTTANEMRVYDGGSWIAASSAGGASLLEYFYTATANQTTFSGSDSEGNTLSYTAGNILVIFNGVVLDPTADYTATDGSSVVMTAAAALDDEVHIIAFKSFTTADMVSKTNGGIFHGNVGFSNGIDVTGNITVTGTVDGVDVGQFKSDYDSHTHTLSQITDAGTAAASATTDFATAAQGTKADTAHSWGDHSTAGYAAASHNHDDRYYTETEADSRFVNVTGDTITGNLNVTGDIRNQGVVLTQNEGGGEVQLLSSNGATRGLIDFLDPDSDNQGHMRFLNLSSDDGGVEIGVAATNPAGNVSLKTNNQERLRVNPDGTTVVRQYLLVGEADNGDYQGMTIRNSEDSGTAQKVSFVDAQNNLAVPDAHMFFTHETDGSSNVILGTTPAGSRSTDRRVERMRINGDGHVAVGRSAPVSGLENYTQFTVSGPEGGIAINSTDTTTGDYSRLMFTKSGSTGNEGLIRYNTGDYHMAFWTNAQERMRIESTGKVRTVAVDGGNTVEALELNNIANVSSAGTGVQLKFKLAQTQNAVESRKYAAIEGVSPVAWGEQVDLRFVTQPYASANNVRETMRIDGHGRVTMPHQPAFDVTYSGGGYGVTHPVVFNTVHVNVGGHYNNTNGRFTCPVTGMYFFYTCHIKDGTTIVTRRRFRKNGAIILNGRHLRMTETSINTYGDNGMFNHVIQCNAGDYITVDQFAGNSYGSDEYDVFGGYLIG